MSQLTYSALLDNLRLNQVPIQLSNAALLQFYNGAIPANADANLSGNTLLANGALPAQYFAAANAKSMAKTGSWSITGNASLSSAQPATFFRMYNAAGTVCGVQGNVGANVVAALSANTAQYSNVLSFANTSGILVNSTAVGANIPAGATVQQVNAGNVVLSADASALLANGASITFTWDISLDNNSIAANQNISINSFTLNSAN